MVNNETFLDTVAAVLSGCLTGSQHAITSLLPRGESDIKPAGFFGELIVQFQRTSAQAADERGVEWNCISLDHRTERGC